MKEELISNLIHEIRYLRNEVSELKVFLGLTEQFNHEATKRIYTPGLDDKITALLQELKIRPQLQGYSMLREAIKMVMHDVSLLRGFSTELYPVIGEMFGLNYKNVERSIRHAIETSYNKNRLHPFYKNYPDKKPTCTQFIAEIADKFRLEQSREEEETCQKIN
jgi:hypothetical protein